MPFAAEGLAFWMTSTRAEMFATSWSASMEALPTAQWMIPFLSTRYSTLPAFCSETARPTSWVTVPSFGFGIRPRGPSTLPRRPTTPIMSGVAITRSNSSQPSSWIFFASSSAPTWSAPASRASCSLSPLAKTRMRTDFPVPCGSTTAPRTIWSACFGSTPRLMATSTLSSNLPVGRFLSTPTASSTG